MSNLRILVVDDEVSILKVISNYLGKRGERCDTAENGEEALALVRQHDYDIVLADLSMPGIDGIELTRQVRVSRPSIPCILMSGRGTRLDVISAMKAGVFDFLDKPFFELAVLAAAVERAAASRRLTSERDSLLEDLKKQNAKLATSLARLNSAYGQLRQQEATLASDLRQSQRVQRKLLPAAFPSMEGFELFGYFAPCERLGGDFFNALPLWDGRLAVYLVDVAGHGVSAAMITIMLRELLQPRRLLQASYEILGSPDKALAFLNQALLEEAFDPPILVTMVYAVIDPKKETITVASAGHPPPLLVESPGVSRPLSVAGPVLGLRSQGGFVTEAVSLKPGQSVLLYTDGVSEARYEGGSFFTTAKLGNAFAARHGQGAASAGRALEEVLRGHLDGHVPADDMTFIVINHTARPLEAEKESSHSRPPLDGSVRVVLPENFIRQPVGLSGGITAGWSAATCVISLTGLATWQMAPAMRRLVALAETDGVGAVRVELAECRSLDSTMLGLFYQCAGKLILHRPTERLLAQFREMGIDEYLRIENVAAPVIDTPLNVSIEAPSAACSDLILSAHEALVEASEENRRRFEGVIESFSSHGALIESR